MEAVRWQHFVLQVFSFHYRCKRSFDWPNSLLYFCYQKMCYFNLMRHWPYQNFRPMSHLISHRCPQSDCVHVGETMIVIALLCLARRTEGGVQFICFSTEERVDSKAKYGRLPLMGSWFFSIFTHMTPPQNFRKKILALI